MRKATTKQVRSIITELTKEQIEQIVNMPIHGGVSVSFEDLQKIIRGEELRLIKEKRKRIINKLLSE